MSIDAQLKYAIHLAANAWDNNAELRKVFGSAKPDKNHPLPITGENVGALLKKIQQKRQILLTAFPNGDGTVAHAVISPTDYYAKLLGKTYAVRETILVAPVFFQDIVRHKVAFTYAAADAAKVADIGIFRAVLLLHEARHIYSLTGHTADPSTSNGSWNDYILWTGFLGQKVAW